MSEQLNEYLKRVKYCKESQFGIVVRALGKKL